MSDTLPDISADSPRGDPDAPRRLRRRWLLGATGATAALGGAALWAGVLPGAGGGAGLPPRGGNHRFLQPQFLGFLEAGFGLAHRAYGA